MMLRAMGGFCQDLHELTPGEDEEGGRLGGHDGGAAALVGVEEGHLSHDFPGAQEGQDDLAPVLRR